MTIIVNKRYIFHTLLPIGGDRDDLFFKYQILDINNENEVRGFIRDNLFQSFEKSSSLYKQGLKLALSYCLTTDKGNVESLYDSILPPINLPDDPKLFFIWLWKELFGDSEWQMENTSEYTLIENDREPYIVYENG